MPETLTPKQRAFLTAFAATGGIHRKAAEAAKVNLSTHYGWLKTVGSPYIAAYEEARKQAVTALVDEATFRAMYGLRKYKFTKDGVPVQFPEGHPLAGQAYYEDHRSDVLMTLILRALDPERFRDNLTVEGSLDASLALTHELRQQVIQNADSAKALCDAINNAIAPAGPNSPADGNAGSSGADGK